MNHEIVDFLEEDSPYRGEVECDLLLYEGEKSDYTRIQGEDEILNPPESSGSRNDHKISPYQPQRSARGILTRHQFEIEGEVNIANALELVDDEPKTFKT